MDKDATSASSTRLSAVDQSGKADASSQGLKRSTSPSPAPSTGSAARRKKLRPPAPKRAGMTPTQATASGAPPNSYFPLPPQPGAAPRSAQKAKKVAPAGTEARRHDPDPGHGIGRADKQVFPAARRGGGHSFDLAPENA